jgi:hypothetical protein
MKKHVTDNSVTLLLSEPIMCGADGEHARDESVSLLVMEGDASVSTYGQLALQVGSLAWPQGTALGTGITGNLSQWPVRAYIGGASPFWNVIVFPGVSPKLAGVSFVAAGLRWSATSVNVSLHDDSYCPLRQERTTEKTESPETMVIFVHVGAACAIAACIAMVVACRCLLRWLLLKQSGIMSSTDAVIGKPLVSQVSGDDSVTEGVPLGGAKVSGAGLECSSVIVGMPVVSQVTYDEPVMERGPLGDARV